jgi:hypothetical protein
LLDNEETQRLKSLVADLSVSNELLREKIHRMEAGRFGLAEVEAMSRARFALHGTTVRRGARDARMGDGAFQLLFISVLSQPSRILGPRGPKTVWSDTALLGKIREVLTASPFYGEGYRKVWARLRFAEVRTSKARASADARSTVAGAITHASKGRKSTQWHNRDHTMTATVEEGQVTLFVAVDHCTTECVGPHAAKKATRFEALEPLRQATRDFCGGFRAGAAAGIRNRHDLMAAST